MERRVLECVLASGEEGVLTKQLFAGLNLSSKRCSALLSDVIRKYALIVNVVALHKTVHNRISAPASLLRQYARANTLLRAGGGGGEPGRAAAADADGDRGELEDDQPTANGAVPSPPPKQQQQRAIGDVIAHQQQPQRQDEACGGSGGVKNKAKGKQGSGKKTGAALGVPAAARVLAGGDGGGGGGAGFQDSDKEVGEVSGDESEEEEEKEVQRGRGSAREPTPPVDGQRNPKTGRVTVS